VSLHVETVIHALRHNPVRFLPRGELFIHRNFLDHFFNGYKGQYLKQLEAAAQRLGLSAVGVELDIEGAHSLLSETRFKELEQYFTVGCINGPISRFIRGHGFFNAMLSMKREPSLFLQMAPGLLKEIENKIRLARANHLSAITIADDIAHNRGLLFSFDYFMDVLWPVYKEIAEFIKGNGLFAFFHSDGDTRKVIELLIKAGYDCIHPVETQAGINLYELKKGFGERVSFMGHIDIMAWSKEHIEKEISLAETESKKGGLILGSTCGISTETVSDKLGLLHPPWERIRPHQ